MLLNHKRVRRERKGFSCGSLTVVNFFVVYFTFLLVQLPASGFLQFSFVSCAHTRANFLVGGAQVSLISPRVVACGPAGRINLRVDNKQSRG
jgi:hypothetical protein